MSSSRTRVLSAAILILLALSATARAELRDWLIDGERFRGEYQGIQGGNVTLRNGGQQQRVHFYALSEADQQYLRKQLEADGQEAKIPKAGPLRTWTDDNGDTFEGRLIGADDKAAYVLSRSKQFRLPLDELAPADREHVEQTLPLLSDRPQPADADPADDADDADPPPADGPDAAPDTDGEPEKPASSEPAEAAAGSGKPAEAGAGETVSAPPTPPRGGSNGPGGWVPPSPRQNRPPYVPPSNKAAALAAGELTAATAIISPGSGGSVYGVLAIVLTVAAVVALVMRHMAQRAG
jgi:hypothetical protein